MIRVSAVREPREPSKSSGLQTVNCELLGSAEHES